MSATVIEPEGRINEVHIEGLALMEIVKHCHDSLPSMVTGSLLGLAGNNGILEVTRAFPNPDSGKDDEIDEDFQVEMMRMLREVNVDNNCIGWYQSVYLGIYSTQTVLENQFSYQTELSPNAVVLLYDPLQTANGNFAMKAFRLTEECVAMKQKEKNDFIKPANIFEEVPVKCTNAPLAKAMIQEWTPTSDIELDRLDLSTHSYLEKHLQYLCGWVDELAGEQQKFQYYTRHLTKGNNKTKASWDTSEAPKRMESLLVNNQIQNYCDQMDRFAGGGLGKLFLAGGLHKEDGSS
ncbi:unnamed protein product [Cylindrotheca closterium]|uniref:Eukaryotic translation initiation factor 3 subunit H n=1 Tax=Cylindrotheca closterium TaxID=2856 RepID=A0AAD2PXS8_9STRA|nr:unnamed protein product [Cylindrotheca closterium]